MASTTFTFTIPNATVTRISNALDKTGYIFNPNLGTTDSQQRLAYFKNYAIALWQADVFNFERQQAILNGTGAAAQVKTFVPLTDITAT